MGFLTSGGLALSGILGSLGGVSLGGWLTGRTQLRTSQASIKAQLDLAKDARKSAIYDKMAAAMTHMIFIIFRFPAMPARIYYVDDETFVPSMEKWFEDFRIAAVPLFAYGTADIEGNLRDDVRAVEASLFKIAADVKDILEHKKANSGRRPSADLAAEIEKLELSWQDSYFTIGKINASLSNKIRQALNEKA